MCQRDACVERECVKTSLDEEMSSLFKTMFNVMNVSRKRISRPRDLFTFQCQDICRRRDVFTFQSRQLLAQTCKLFSERDTSSLKVTPLPRPARPEDISDFPKFISHDSFMTHLGCVTSHPAHDSFIVYMTHSFFTRLIYLLHDPFIHGTAGRWQILLDGPTRKRCRAGCSIFALPCSIYVSPSLLISLLYVSPSLLIYLLYVSPSLLISLLDHKSFSVASTSPSQGRETYACPPLHQPQHLNTSTPQPLNTHMCVVRASQRTTDTAMLLALVPLYPYVSLPFISPAISSCIPLLSLHVYLSPACLPILPCCFSFLAFLYLCISLPFTSLPFISL